MLQTRSQIQPFLSARNCSADALSIFLPMTRRFHPFEGGHAMPMHSNCRRVQPPRSDLAASISSLVSSTVSLMTLSSPPLSSCGPYNAFYALYSAAQILVEHDLLEPSQRRTLRFSRTPLLALRGVLRKEIWTAIDQVTNPVLDQHVVITMKEPTSHR